jgi:hypothetical protein
VEQAETSVIWFPVVLKRIFIRGERGRIVQKSQDFLVLEERQRMSSSASSSSSSSSSSSPTHTSDESVEIYTPELLWHGGGNENGKPDPVYSVDIHPLDVLATAGIDANIPPKGSVRVRIF